MFMFTVQFDLRTTYIPKYGKWEMGRFPQQCIRGNNPACFYLTIENDFSNEGDW